jgi:hypothetical protein
MSNLIPISAKMVGTTAYRKMYLARHVEKRIAAFEARVAELEKENNILTDRMMEIRGLVRPIVQNSSAILEEATISKASEGKSSNKESDL